MKHKWRKLSDIAEINPRRPVISCSDDKLTSFVPMASVDGVEGVIAKAELKAYSEVQKGFTYFQDNDVIFAKITPCMQNGKHALVLDVVDGFGFGSTEFHVIRAGKEVCPEWIHFFLRRKETLDAAVKTFKGAVGQQRVPTEFLENLFLPCPPIEVQRCIASRLKAQLAEVEKARTAAELQLEEAMFLESRVLFEVFKKIEHEPLEVISDWAETTSGSTPSRGNKDYWAPAEIPWVRTAEVVFNPIIQTEECISSKALKECSVKLLPPKTVLVAMYGQGKTRGQSAVLEVEATTNQACFAVLPNKRWVPEFMQLWFQKSYLELRSLSESRGGNQANLNGGILKALKVPAPSIEKQLCVLRLLNEALSDVNKIRRACISNLDNIRVLPQKILSEAFGDEGMN